MREMRERKENEKDKENKNNSNTYPACILSACMDWGWGEKAILWGNKGALIRDNREEKANASKFHHKNSSIESRRSL